MGPLRETIIREAGYYRVKWFEMWQVAYYDAHYKTWWLTALIEPKFD